ncbi:MAG TPA: hypothetical protein VFY26_13750 [Anaerolineales bacterium]|nr:hypothetical protein [Anaerolineales bacterium]
MNEELMALLIADYRQAIKAQAADYAEAEESRQIGSMATYFDLRQQLLLPEICWSLERWEEAKTLYRQNARVMIEARAWHAKHSGPEYPLEETTDWLAATVVKAGDLVAAREYIKSAIVYWQKQTSNNLVLSRLGLHAAQVGLPDLATHARAVVTARHELPGGRNEKAHRARELLHYEPAQVSLMLGRWDEFQEEVKALEEGERLVKDKPGLAFPEPLQGALVAASRGLRKLGAIHAGVVEAKTGRETARDAFEESMLSFYKFVGRVDWNLYFMRLNTRFADDLAAGQPPNPNPFDGGWSLERQVDK